MPDAWETLRAFAWFKLVLFIPSIPLLTDTSIRTENTSFGDSPISIYPMSGRVSYLNEIDEACALLLSVAMGQFDFFLCVVFLICLLSRGIPRLARASTLLGKFPAVEDVRIRQRVEGHNLSKQKPHRHAFDLSPPLTRLGRTSLNMTIGNRKTFSLLDVLDCFFSLSVKETSIDDHPLSGDIKSIPTSPYMRGAAIDPSGAEECLMVEGMPVSHGNPRVFDCDFAASTVVDPDSAYSEALEDTDEFEHEDVECDLPIGRRRESVAAVAWRWTISEADAAELMRNFEESQGVEVIDQFF